MKRLEELSLSPATASRTSQASHDFLSGQSNAPLDGDIPSAVTTKKSPLKIENEKFEDEIHRSMEVFFHDMASVPSRLHSIIRSHQIRIDSAINFVYDNIENSRKRGPEKSNQSLHEWIMAVGAGLYVKDQNDSLGKTIDGTNASASFQRTRDLMDFYHTPETSIKIGDLSLGQLHDDRDRREIGPALIFDFFMQASAINRNPDLVKPSWSDRHPEMTRAQTARAAEAILALAITATATDSPKTFFAVYRSNGTDKEYLEKAIPIMKRIYDTRDQLLEGATNPLSATFQDFKRIAEKYLKTKDKKVVFDFFDILTLHDPDHQAIKRLYRFSKVFSSYGHYRDFYSAFLQRLVEYSRRDKTLFPLEKAKELVGPEQMDEVELSTFKPLVNGIFSKSRQTEYSIGSSNISFSDLEPDRISVLFDKIHPTQFKVSFWFGEETLEISINCSPKNGNAPFEWNLLQSPDDPELKGLHQATMIAVQKVLEEVDGQIARDKSEKQQPSVIVYDSQPPKPKREKPAPEQAVEQKKRKRISNGESNGHGETLEVINETPEVAGNLWQIALPEARRDFLKLFKGYDPRDIDHVVATIKRFNKENASGDFKKLTDTTTYRLKVGRKKGRAVNVFAEVDEAIPGTLRVIAVKHRSDSYKRSDEI